MQVARCNAIAGESVPVVCPVCLSVTLVYCDQTVRWIKMPLGTKVGLGPGEAYMGTELPHGKAHSSPHFSAYVYFGPCLLWPNGRPSQQLPSSCLAFFLCVGYTCRASMDSDAGKCPEKKTAKLPFRMWAPKFVGRRLAERLNT